MKKIKYILIVLLLVITGAFGYIVSEYYTYEAKQNEVREFRTLAFEGYSLVNAGKDEAALQAYQKAVAIYDKDARSLSDLAMLYRKSGEFEKAKEYYLKAYEANKDGYEYLYNAALTHYLLEEYAQVIDSIEKLLHIDSNRLKYYRLLSVAAFALGDKDKAFGYYRVLDDRGSYRDDEFLASVKAAYQELEEKPQSLEVVYRYLITDDESELEALMYEYKEAGYDVKSLRTAQKILYTNPNHNEANKVAAELLFVHNAISEAYLYVSKIEEHDFRSLEILGASFQNKGEYEKALEAYEQSYAKHPTNDLLRAMAVCAWKNQNEQEVINYVARLKAVDPLLATQLVYAMGIDSGVENNFFDKVFYLAQVEFYKGYCKIRGCDDA